MEDRKNNDFVGYTINGVINEVRISSRNDFPYILDSLSPSNLREQQEILQRIKNGGPYTQ